MENTRKITLKGLELEAFLFNSTYSFLNGLVMNWEQNKKLIEEGLEMRQANPEDQNLTSRMLTIAAYFSRSSCDNIDFMVEADMWKPAKEGWVKAYERTNWDNYKQVGISQEDLHTACATYNLSRIKKEKALKLAQEFNKGKKNVRQDS